MTLPEHSVRSSSKGIRTIRLVAWSATFAALVGLWAAVGVASPILPWEANITTVEAGSLRGLAQRLNRQYLFYKVRVGNVRRADMVETAQRIDHVLLLLQKGEIPRVSELAMRALQEPIQPCVRIGECLAG